MHTLLQTSDKRFAVRSLISLCLMEGNPPFGQDKACSTEKLVPQSQPAIPKAQGIPEGALVQGEGEFHHREGSKPARRSFLLGKGH